MLNGLRRGSGKGTKSISSDSVASAAFAKIALNDSPDKSGTSALSAENFSLSPVSPPHSEKKMSRKMSLSQFDAGVQQQLNQLDFYTNVLLRLRESTEAYLKQTEDMVKGIQGLANCIGVGMLEDGDLDAVHDFNVGIGRIQQCRLAELSQDMSSTVLQPIQQTINLNYSLDMRLKEREDMALDIENAKRKGEEVAEMEVRKVLVFWKGAFCRWAICICIYMLQTDPSLLLLCHSTQCAV